MSQLGFMTLLCGVGAFVAAIFHLLAHGFFKAFLFLSTGNVLASTHRPREARARDASGPMKPLFAGALLMSSIPPLVIFSGPYQHLWVAQDFTAARVLFWIVGLGTVFFTALYMFRGVTSLFSEGASCGTWKWHIIRGRAAGVFKEARHQRCHYHGPVGFRPGVRLDVAQWVPVSGGGPITGSHGRLVVR